MRTKNIKTTALLSWCLLGFILNLVNGNFTEGVYAGVSKEDEAIFMAKRAFEDGFYDVSLGLFERFLKSYPDSARSPEANLFIGQCYFHQNKFLDALAKFEWLLNQPAAANIRDAVLYWIAEVHFRGNDFNKAAAYYTRIVQEFPASTYAPAANYSLGWCLFQARDFTRALEYFKVVEEKFPKEPFVKEAVFKSAECLYNLKDYAQLKERLKNYLQTYNQEASKSAYLYFYLAEAEYYLDNFSDSIDGYKKAISATHDEKIQALSKLGIAWAYLKLKKYKESEDAFAAVKADNLERSSRDVLSLGQAILMGEAKKFKEASGIYQELAAQTNDPVVLVQAYTGRAEALYNIGDYTQAINVYREVLPKISKEIPQDIIDKLHYGLAWAYLKEAQFKEAIEEFQKIVKQSDDKIVKVSALCQIGDAYQDSANYPKAIEAYDNILKNFPDTFYSDYVQYQLGLAQLKSANYEGAVVSFHALRRNFPGSKLLDDASYALGLSYFQREDYNASREVFEKFQDEFKESYLKPQAMYLLGTSLYNLGKFNEAIEVFKNIIRLYGQDIELLQKAEYEIADCLYRMGQENEAMEKFNSLRSKYPDSSLTSEVVWWLGEYYYRHNDLSLARRYFSSLIRDFPDSSLVPNAYYALGSTYEEDANYEEAIKNFSKVLEFGKSDLAGTASIAIADIFALQDKIDHALAGYRQTISAYPNLATLVYPKMAAVYSKAGNYEEAVAFYRKTQGLASADEMSNIQFKIAETREAEGAWDQAVEEYLKVTYLYAQNSTLAVKSFLRVGAIYENKQNFKEAKNIYAKVIAMNVTESKFAQERLDWIMANVKE